MESLTNLLLSTAPDLDAAFRVGAELARAGCKPKSDYQVLATVRGRHGFKAVASTLLTPPKSNIKLDKSAVATFGLTLFHFRSVLDAVPELGLERLSINACPHAGHCVKVCVLNNGNGRYDSVRRAWLWRTDLLAREPESFVRILAWELVRGVAKYGRILFRPNVNSDVAWELVLPSLVNGFVDGVMSYGYSKLPSTLAGDGWLGSHYRVAYSWNERSDADAVSAFVARGGAVAVVTSRKRGGAVLEDLPFVRSGVPVVDADLTDDWMLASYGIVGDLSAKGKARQLIGRSRFVVTELPAKRRTLTLSAAA